MVELVDTRDLKSLGHRLCRFKPGSGYQNTKSRRKPVCGFSFFSSPPSTGGTSPQAEGEAGQARPSLPGDRPGRSGARHQYEMASKTPSTRQVPPCRCKMPERLSCISSTASSRRASVEQRDAKSSVSEPARL